VHGNETILLVEDEKALLNLTKKMLEEEGYIVLAAGTPSEAIQIAHEHVGDIHLLVTDVIMPEMNGRELTKSLTSFYPNIRCLYMSGYTADIIANHGILDEGIHFIRKPFSIDDMTVKIRQAMND
jgi:two-component system, cell cycle sensor histidine kinase and response regulator CckA